MMIALCDARVIDADLITRELQMPGKAGHTRIVEEFGKAVLTDTGELDRRKLADIVFNDKKQLQRLNDIIHPLVLNEEARMLEMYVDDPLVVLMVPLLYETGTDRMCDKVAVVTVSDTERMRRVAERDNMPPEVVMQRLASQMPQEEKAKRADFVIDNSGSTEGTEKQVLMMLKQLGIAIKRNH
jgi:dephospho-CoA kinase